MYRLSRIPGVIYVLPLFVHLFMFYWPYTTALTHSSGQVLNSSYILLHTLNGELRLVDRKTGIIKWTKSLDPALSVSYSGGPILIVDPLEGRIYEYSAAASDDLLTHLDHSIMGYVRRSPAYYNHHISFGSKTDHWMSIDLLTGTTLHSPGRRTLYGCPTTVKSIDGLDYDPLKSAYIGFGYTRYNLLFRDSLSGIPKLNITYNTFASHFEPALQTIDLQHVATIQPSLVTFSGMRLLWSLPLPSPVVGLYAVCWSPRNVSLPDCQFASGFSTVGDEQPSHLHVPMHTSNDGTDHTAESEQLLPLGASPEPKAPVRFPCVLRKIAFTTYALDVSSEPYLSSHLNNLRLEAKFNGKLDLALSLLLNNSAFAPLYAIPCVAEASLPLRGIHMVPGRLLLEGPIATSESPCEYTDPVCLSQVLVGLYELPPTQLSRWSSADFVPLWVRASRLRQITDQNTGWGIIIPPFKPVSTNDDDSVKAIAGPTGAPSTRTPSAYSVSRIFIAIVTTTIVTWIVAGKLNRGVWYKGRTVLALWRAGPSSVPDANSTLLPPSFDVPDNEGWAGCSAEEARQPDAVRFNVNHVLGCGANGTMVFAGTYGEHQTAVKRIIRQARLEKHWRREHDILLRHFHPNLVKCFWTGSTANFHYLIMQRCVASLAEVFRWHTPDCLSQWNLTPTEVMRQISLAIACLHYNKTVHRDLKPSNVLIVSDGSRHRVVVGDFGLSRPIDAGCPEVSSSFGTYAWIEPGQRTSEQSTKLADEDTVRSHLYGSSVAYCRPDGTVCYPVEGIDCAQSSAGIAYGTLGWMAPELCDPSRANLTFATDIFSFGLLAYFLFTCGGHPFDSDSSVHRASSRTPGNRIPVPDPYNSEIRSLAVSRLDDVNMICSPTTHVSMHHARQVAIAENRQPSLHHLTDNQSDLATGFLVRQLIQNMLSSDPKLRPTAEEVSANPLFWPPRKTMLFIAEISDLLDIRKDDFDGQLMSSGDSVDSSPASDSFVAQRRALLRDIERFGYLVFNKHWFHRLEPNVVQDLLVTRGYQDTSLMDLLRAIRNKRNHLWHLSENIRSVLGHTQEGMARYWTSRFPALVPLLYGASRCHLAGFRVMVEFLPPRETSISEVISEWWHVPALDRVFCTEGSGVEGNQENSCCRWRTQTYSHFQESPNIQWRRGGVISNSISDTHPFASQEFNSVQQGAGHSDGPAILDNPKVHRNHKTRKARPPKRKLRTGESNFEASFPTIPDPGDAMEATVAHV